MKNKYNPLIFSNEDIYVSSNEIYTNENIDENSSDEFIDIFSFENFSLEYSFQTEDCSLYKETSDGKFILLYECEHNDNGTKNCSFYSDSSTYVLTKYDSSKNFIGSLDYIPKMRYIDFINRFASEPKIKLFSTISDMLTLNYMNRYFVNLIKNNNYYQDNCTTDMLDEYRKLFIAYTTVSNLIPASNILEEFIKEIHNYIVTGKCNTSNLEMKFLDLQHFKKVCPNSTNAIYSFLNNPSSTDLRGLCDSLGKNLTNIDNLIDLYLVNELEVQK